MSTGPLVHGVVDYANAAPLVEGLPAGSLRHGVPSQLAAWLADGSVDVALLPVVELARIPGVVAVPRWGIAASGRCDSVLLFHRVPLAPSSSRPMPKSMSMETKLLMRGPASPV